MHLLKLYIRDSQLNAGFLIISDVSQYESDMPILNRSLFVQVPGYSDAIEILLPMGGTMFYGARSLGLSNSNVVCDIPDGLYTLTYSIAPNDKVNTVHYHFRTTLLQKELNRRITALTIFKDDVYATANGALIREREALYLKIVLLLESLKGIISGEQDLATANEIYKVIQQLLNTDKVEV